MRTTAVTYAIRQKKPAVNISWFTHRRGSALLAYVPGVTAINVEDVPYETYRDAVEHIDGRFRAANALTMQQFAIQVFQNYSWIDFSQLCAIG